MPFVVLKFGGSSVSSLASWRTIEAVVRARRADGLRPLVVCSALSGVSDQLDLLAAEAAAGRRRELLAEIEERHAAHAEALGVDPELVRGELDTLERLAMGAALIGECPPQLRTRIMVHGELLSTRLGAAFLADRRLGCGWLDARELLTSVPEPGTRGLLSARCEHAHDPALVERLEALEPVLLTQGFIARDPEGRTVLLGRGGSDTSAALLAARLGAARLELCSDVLVAEAGVLVAPVTQLKDKGALRYVGIGTGMNSLIRPALFGARHPIVNLTRLGEPAARRVQVVGPICETGDTLGWDRLLPETAEGDVLLIDVVGAYGRAMASRYNLREPAGETVLPAVAG